MKATPRSDPRSIGVRLAEQLYPSKPRRRATHEAGRQRPKRPTRRAEAQRLLRDVRTLAAERPLEQSPMGQELLRLTDLRLKALFKEQFAVLALTTARQDAERAREHHQHVCSQGLHQQYEQAHFKLKVAETTERQANRLLAEAVTARGLVDAELRLLAEAARA